MLVAVAVVLLPGRGVAVSAGTGLEPGTGIGIAACDAGYGGIESESDNLGRIRSRPYFFWVGLRKWEMEDGEEVGIWINCGGRE